MSKVFRFFSSIFFVCLCYFCRYFVSNCMYNILNMFVVRAAFTCFFFWLSVFVFVCANVSILISLYSDFVQKNHHTMHKNKQFCNKNTFTAMTYTQKEIYRFQVCRCCRFFCVCVCGNLLNFRSIIQSNVTSFQTELLKTCINNKHTNTRPLLLMFLLVIVFLLRVKAEHTIIIHIHTPIKYLVTLQNSSMFFFVSTNKLTKTTNRIQNIFFQL